jgi:disulfide bond formation protein DsbB
MTRYVSLPWPWLGFLLAIALVGQEELLRWFGAAPAINEAVYRVAVMSLGVSCLALRLQYGEGLEPCPLCMFQRVAVIAAGIVFLIAAIQNPFRPGAALYALLILVIAGAGAAFAGRQIWLQALPKDQVPACGMGLHYMMDTLPFMDVIVKVLQGSGECAEKGWVFLGLSIAGWTFVFFAAMIVAAIALIRRD